MLLTREPGGTPEAEAIRALLLGGHDRDWSPKTETLLHFAARCQHLDQAIRPALAAGQWVITDRFADSTAVYQGCGQGVDPAWIAAVAGLVVGGDAPDLTIVLDLDPAVAQQRLRGRGDMADRYERLAADFHQRVRDGFLALAQAAPQRCVLIDADQPTEFLHAAIVEEVDRRCAQLTATP